MNAIGKETRYSKDVKDIQEIIGYSLPSMAVRERKDFKSKTTQDVSFKKVKQRKYI